MLPKICAALSNRQMPRLATSRVIEFPPRRSLGTLAVRPWGSKQAEDWVYRGKARGRIVSLPSDQEVLASTSVGML